LKTRKPFLFALSGFFLFAIFLFDFHSTVCAQTFSLKGKLPYRQGEILVRLKPEASSADRAKTLSALGRARTLRDANLFRIKLKDGQDVLKTIESLKNDPAVQWAQPNHIYYPLASCPPTPITPTDFYFSSPYSWPLSIIHAPQAWSYYSNFAVTTTGPAVGCPPGTGVTVAVLDSGISRNHPDLRNVPLIGYNAINDVKKTSPVYDSTTGPVTASDDDYGHGTFVAAIIGASWDTSAVTEACGPTNTTGMAGLAPGAVILAVKVLGLGYGDCGAGNACGDTASIVSGIDFAVAHGARVISMSLGSPFMGGIDPEEQQAMDLALAAGCVIVAATGNESESGAPAEVNYPAAYPPVIAVGASTVDDQVAFYSNQGRYLDLVAPGGSAVWSYNPNADVFSAILKCPGIPYSGFNFYSTDNNFCTAAGTSAATPYVSAAAALILALYPNLTNEQVAHRIIDNTDSLTGSQAWNSASGYGRLNVLRALANDHPGIMQFVKTFNSPNPFHPESDGSTNITLAITRAAPVELKIYDTGGEKVYERDFSASELNQNSFNPQFKSFYVSWDGRNGSGQKVKTGVYFYTVKINGQTGNNKIAVISNGK
jgi:hypothetical protein